MSDYVKRIGIILIVIALGIGTASVAFAGCSSSATNQAPSRPHGG